MPNDTVKQLTQIDLFTGLGRDDLRAVAKLLKQADYPAGHIVSRQGEIGNILYFVKSGDLRIQHVDPLGIEKVVGQLGPGDYFGQTSLLLSEPRDATVTVINDATLLYLNKDEFDQVLANRPALLEDLEMRPDVARKRHARQLHFKWQDEDEIIIVSEHRHNALLVRNIALPCFALLVVMFLLVYSWRTGAIFVSLVSALLSLILLVFIIYLIADHRDDIYIVTNKRVVRRYRTPLGPEASDIAPLRAIQDVQEVQVGLLAQWFDFGDLIIETAGEREHLAFREIPDPEWVREAIFEQKERTAAGAKMQERDAIYEDMQRYFEVQGVEEKAPPPAPKPEEARSRLSSLSTLVQAPARIITYFLPPLRYEQGDTITWRKHWIALIKPIALPTLLIIASTITALFLLWSASDSLGLVLVGYGIGLVILLPWWLWRFDDWQNDIYQVTATRIIDVERLPFYLREERREANLGMIQNISLDVPSVLGRILRYGSVTIETAGAEAFTFDYVKNPNDVQAEIFRRMEAFQKRQSLTAAESHRRELLDWFAVYDQMRRSSSPASQSPPSRQQET
jgi:hypothetical protein